MIKCERLSRDLCVILISTLVVCLIPGRARASDLPASHDESVHAFEGSDAWVIGSVESLATFSINGRRAQGSETLWNGDLIQVSTDSSARALLGSVGEILMKRGALLRLSTVAAQDDREQGRVLVASLIRGEIVVALRRGAVAYVETDDTAVRASGEGSFRVGTGEIRTMVSIIDGAVGIQASIKRRLTPTLLGSVPAQRVGAKSDVKCRTGETTGLRFRVTMTKITRRASLREVVFIPGGDSGSAQTSSDEEPASGRIIRFQLDKTNDIGNLSSDEVITDQNGEATVRFIASDNAGSARLIARVVIDPATEETTPWVGTITVVKSTLITRNRAYVAALTGVVLATWLLRGKKPLKKEGDPIPVP